MSFFEPTNKDLFFKSTKSGDGRLGEFVNTSSSAATTYVIAGYPDDEGIQINGGRVGAKQAPDAIRKYFYKTTPTEKTPTYKIEDIGNLKISGTLSERHEAVKKKVLHTLQENKIWVGLGGGHDYGYPDGAGFLKSCVDSKYKPLVINFDAHLDVRPADQGLSSGTPFYRLLTDSELPVFDFVEIGIQKQCNSPTHKEWLQEKTPHIFDLDDLLIESNWAQSLFAKMAPLLVQKRPAFVSIDIDAFSSAIAPGCSQSWAAGLDANSFLVFLGLLKKRLDIRCVGIYEVSPPLDTDDRTSKWAAQILHHVIHA